MDRAFSLPAWAVYRFIARASTLKDPAARRCTGRALPTIPQRRCSSRSATCGRRVTGPSRMRSHETGGVCSCCRRRWSCGSTALGMWRTRPAARRRRCATCCRGEMGRGGGCDRRRPARWRQRSVAGAGPRARRARLTARSWGTTKGMQFSTVLTMRSDVWPSVRHLRPRLARAVSLRRPRGILLEHRPESGQWMRVVGAAGSGSSNLTALRRGGAPPASGRLGRGDRVAPTGSLGHLCFARAQARSACADTVGAGGGVRGPMGVGSSVGGPTMRQLRKPCYATQLSTTGFLYSRPTLEDVESVLHRMVDSSQEPDSVPYSAWRARGWTTAVAICALVEAAPG